MNELHTQVCFDALSVLNNVQYVESVCNLCGNQHYTGNCPEIKQGTYVPDTPQQSISRSSVPNGLLVMDSEDGGTCVITSQKFAKGTRFGPLLAPTSYLPIKGIKFPLIIFPTQQIKEEIAEIQTLFNARNIYLDTTDENKCNWMIHVNTAKYSNEQNLICYQENYAIYYAAIQDIELGDILKVWYSSIYASKIGVNLLEASPYDICNNILRQVSIDYGIRIDDNNVLDTTNSYSVYEDTAGCSDISLPPVISLMKISSPNYNYTSPSTSSQVFDLNLTSSSDSYNTLHRSSELPDMSLSFDSNGALFDCDTGISSNQDLSTVSSQNESEIELAPVTTTDVASPPSQQQDTVKFSCEVCSRKYATKLTLEKHLRTHDLYLCIVCDKLYHSLNEMQDHECYKKRNKTRPLHCNVCLKLLSNSWSLNRHMKIHRTNDEKPLLPLSATEDMQIKSENESENGKIEGDLQTAADQQTNTGQNVDITSAASKPKPPGKRLDEPMECIVCRRPFKNPNALEKHLRFIHTVYTKDPNRPDYKKYVQEARNKSTLTNNTTPVKPSIAKALASKLTKKKSIMNQEECISKTNDTQMQPPLNHCNSNVNNNSPSKRDNNTIIIISNVELTNGNMFNTQHLLNTPNSQVNLQVLNNNDKLPKLVPIANQPEALTQPQYEPLSPVICNGDTAVIQPTAPVETPPKMIVLKKQKKGEVTGINTDLLNIDEVCGVNKKDEPLIYNCDECTKTFAKKYQLKRHQETHDLVYYSCPYCDKAPLKARSSLKKHFSRDHNDKIEEWNTSNFLSKQILRDEEKLKELKRKYYEKKRLRAVANDKLAEACKLLNADETTSTSADTVDSVDFDNNNLNAAHHNVSTNFTLQHKMVNGKVTMSTKKINKKMASGKINCDLKTKIIHNNNNNNSNQSIKKYVCGDQQTIVVTANNLVNYPQNSFISNNCFSNNNLNISKKQKLLNGEYSNYENYGHMSNGNNLHNSRDTYYLNHPNTIINESHSAGSSGTHSDESVISKSDEHEIIDNLFDNLINDNLLDPLNGNEYEGDDDHAMQSVNYIQETFQNSFDKIQEKLDADLEVSNEQIKWEDNLKSDDSSDEIMSDKLLGIDENVMLM